MKQSEMVNLVADELWAAPIGGEMSEPPTILNDAIYFSLHDGSFFKITVSRTDLQVPK